MQTTNVVVVTNFTKNSTSGAKRAGGRLLPLLRGKTRHLFFCGKSDIFFYVLYFLTNMLDTIKA